MAAHALNRSLTFKAEDSKLLSWVRVARLVLVLVERAHAELAPPTLRLGHGDWVADAAVGQPAVVAAVKPRPPGCVEVAWSGEHGVVLLALVAGLLQGELLAEGGGVEDLAFRQREQTYVRSEYEEVRYVSFQSEDGWVNVWMVHLKSHVHKRYTTLRDFSRL